MKTNYIKKPSVKELKKAYKFRCSCIYYGILSACFLRLALDLYYWWNTECFTIIGWLMLSIAFIYFISKWIHLKYTKFRKRGWYDQT